MLACGGSWMCPATIVDAQKFDEIEALCRKSVMEMHGFSLLHVGLNSTDAKEAETNANIFANIFSLPVTELTGSYFAGTMIEVVKHQFLGEHGHIAICTNNVDRAMAYFEKRGYTFRSEGIAKDEKGTIAVYFKQEVGGFAIHLRRKL